MNIRFLLPLFSLLLCALPARATVLIYQGTVSRFDAGDAVPVSSGKCFVVVDFAAKELGILRYGKIDGVKRREAAFSYDGVVSAFARADGKMQRGFSYATSIELNPGTPLAYASVFFRGVAKTLVVRRSGGVDITEQGPKTMAGSYLFYGTANVQDERFTMSYDEVRSVPANNAGKTLSAVLTDLKAELDARGFSL